jgi:predicted MPP superfamily phosphohydrolase
MKRFTFLFTFLAFVFIINAQDKTLLFNKKGEFKIVQFTDIHYVPNDKKSGVALELIREVMEQEKPDLVVITGDLVFGKPARKCFDDVLSIIIEYKTPWAFVFGNHDDEFDMSRKDMMRYIENKAYSLAVRGNKEVHGVGNYTVELKDKWGRKQQMVFYFMDSGAYSPIKDIEGYDWFAFSQIAWYRDQSAMFKKNNRDILVPALAFFHIPLQEYGEMVAGKNTIVGSRKEKENPGAVNSGMFAAMCESGDVVGVFTGHDHDNDYIGNYRGIALAFGRYSGGIRYIIISEKMAAV